MKLFLKQIAFQILLYKGSHVKDQVYAPLMSRVNELTGKNASLVDYHFFSRNEYKEDVFLIGHSFGGYFALLDYFKNQHRVKGIVLLNSHFNSKKKAIYPKISQEDVEAPVLTVLGGKDDRLPIKKAIHDYFEKEEKNFIEKYYIIEPQAGHFFGLKNAAEIEKLAGYIYDFYTDTKNNNFTKTIKNTEITKTTFSYDFFNILPNTINFNWSLNLYDGLFKLLMPEYLWIYFHYLWFLYAKPTDSYNTQFNDEDSILFKTRNMSLEKMIYGYEKNLNIKFGDKKITTLPTLGVFIPVWLLYYPAVNKDTYEIVQIIINKETTYYKFPNPRRLMIKKIDYR